MDAHPNELLIREFYEAFANCDGETMSDAYRQDAQFTDPVFSDLDGAGAGAMWMMLTEQATDLEIEFSDVEADDERGKAHWEARYTFSATGRKVHNVIDAEFRFQDGKIVKHVDRFDFYRWARMALGPMGLLLGWTPMLQRKVSRTAMKNLARYREKRGI